MKKLTESQATKTFKLTAPRVRIIKVAIILLMLLMPLIIFIHQNLGIHEVILPVGDNVEISWQVYGILFLALIGYILLSNRNSI